MEGIFFELEMQLDGEIAQDNCANISASWRDDLRLCLAVVNY